MSKPKILCFIVPFKSSLTLFCWDIHQFAFLTWIHVRNLSFSVQTGFNYGLHEYFQLVYMEWKFQLGLFKPWGSFSSVYRDEIFAYNGNSVGLSYLIKYSLWKNMHGNKNDDFFSIIHSCHIDLIISSYVDWNGSKENIQFFRKNVL